MSDGRWKDDSGLEAMDRDGRGVLNASSSIQLRSAGAAGDSGPGKVEESAFVSARCLPLSLFDGLRKPSLANDMIERSDRGGLRRLVSMRRLEFSQSFKMQYERK